jgi:transposase InsO family protein
VRYLVQEKDYSERHACELLGVSRSTYRYERRVAADEAELRTRLHELANEHDAYGYRMVGKLLRRERGAVNHKRIHRLWQEEGLQQSQRKPRKRYLGPKGEVKEKARYPNHVWSYDFAEDRTTRGSKVRILAVLDEYTRECLALVSGRSISSRDVLLLLDWLFLVSGVPAHIRSDNGPEFVARRVRQWLERRQCETIFITPGSPWEKPFIESFIGTLRRECLDRYLFDNHRQAQELLDWWRQEYNARRPHSSLDYLTPEEFTERVRAAQVLAEPPRSETVVSPILSS